MGRGRHRCAVGTQVHVAVAGLGPESGDEIITTSWRDARKVNQSLAFNLTGGSTSESWTPAVWSPALVSGWSAASDGRSVIMVRAKCRIIRR